MVGIPGRSKACKTCKQRKVACSLEQPICKVCIKSNRECGGYRRDRIFIHDARTQKEALRTPPKFSAPALPLKLVSASNEQPNPPPQELQGTISLKNAYTSLWTIANPTTRSLYRQQIISEFLYSFLPDQKSSNWLTMLPLLPHFTSALEASSLAVCTAHLGHLNSCPTLIRESLKFYIQALWELQKALWSEDLMHKDETLAACMLLIMYEVTECPDKTIGAWEGHMNGCAKMFETRGPDSFNDEFGHRLFNSFRQLEIQQALVHKRETFLASPEWKERPWKFHPKPISQELLDIESELAKGIASVYSNPSSSSPEEFFFALLEVIKISWELDAQLASFYKRLEAQANGPLYWPTLSQGFNHTIKTPDPENAAFPVAFQFQDTTTAHTCLLYWSITSILWSGMSKIYDILGAMQKQAQLQGETTIAAFMPPVAIADYLEPSPPPFLTPPTPASEIDLALFSLLPPLEHRTDVSIPAKNICQSLEYCWNSPQGPTAATAAVFPLKVAIESLCVMGGCEKELEWAKGAFEALAGTKGVQILKHLGREVEKKAYLPG